MIAVRSRPRGGRLEEHPAASPGRGGRNPPGTFPGSARLPPLTSAFMTRAQIAGLCLLMGIAITAVPRIPGVVPAQVPSQQDSRYYARVSEDMKAGDGYYEAATADLQRRP